MQHKTGIQKMLSAVMVVVLFCLAGLELSWASEAATDIGQANGQWPLVAWYGFSIVLALIGYITAKSKG
ncbi:MAG: hypothetical protein Kow0065_21030 [Methylomicrobium sp.]